MDIWGPVCILSSANVSYKGIYLCSRVPMVFRRGRASTHLGRCFAQSRYQALLCIKNINISLLFLLYVRLQCILLWPVKHCREFGAARGHQLANIALLPIFTSQKSNPVSVDDSCAPYLVLGFRIPMSYVFRPTLAAGSTDLSVFLRVRGSACACALCSSFVKM